MGVGFLDFLDGIESKVKNGLKTYQKPSGEYDFLDSDQEVAIDEKDIGAGLDNSDQEFEGLSDDGSQGEESGEDSQSRSEDKSSSMSDIEDDLGASEQSVDYREFAPEDSDDDKDREDVSMSEEQGESEMMEEYGEEEMSELLAKHEPKTIWTRDQEPKPTSKSKTPSPESIAHISKTLRSILNRVSEGNIDPMFKSLETSLDELLSKYDPNTVWTEYHKIFCQLTMGLQQNMNAILSVNCVYVTAIHRLRGPLLFGKICKQFYDVFQQETADKTSIKNILNCLLHFYLFKVMTPKFLTELIEVLLSRFTESDIEVLIFVMHNIGFQLRNEEPEAIQKIIEMAESQKNSHAVKQKMENIEEDGAKAKKIHFLMLEL